MLLINVLCAFDFAWRWWLLLDGVDVPSSCRRVRLRPSPTLAHRRLPTHPTNRPHFIPETIPYKVAFKITIISYQDIINLPPPSLSDIIYPIITFKLSKRNYITTFLCAKCSKLTQITKSLLVPASLSISYIALR